MYFVTSDIHGFYDVLIQSLDRAGFDRRDHNHHLIVVGDLFDRGKQSKEVLEYLYQLYQEDRCTIIMGNHDYFLLELFEENIKRCQFNVLHNGFEETLQSLSGMYHLDKENDHRFLKYKEIIQEQYPYLESFIRSLPPFYSLGKYVFVHGGLDGSRSDWINTPLKELLWNKQSELPTIPNHMIVSGHQRVATIRYPKVDYKVLFQEHPEAFDILYLPNNILIDRFVEISHELNVLVLDEKTLF